MFHSQGPKFVSDEEIERIKAKIEEDNKAIAALDIKNERQKYGKNYFFSQNVNILLVPKLECIYCLLSTMFCRKDAVNW